METTTSSPPAADAARERALVVGLLRSTAENLRTSVRAAEVPRGLSRWLAEYVSALVSGMVAGILHQVAERVERGEHLAPLGSVRWEPPPHAYQEEPSIDHAPGTCTMPCCGRPADDPIHAASPAEHIPPCG
jgi:hypothetical protein